MPKYKLAEAGNPAEAIREFLAGLLRQGVVEAVLVGRWLPSNDLVVPSLISKGEGLAEADPLAPIAAVSAAKILSDLTRRGMEAKIAAVLRPCELKATRELAKLKQVNLASILTIGMDCPGTLEVEGFRELVKRGTLAKDRLPGPPGGEASRTACRICLEPVPQGTDIALEYLGLDGALHLEMDAALGELLGLESAEGSEGREAFLAELTEERKEVRERELAEFCSRMAQIEGLLEELAPCIRCHNCTVACPLCYCRECLFRTPTFEHQGYQYLDWARKRGAIRLPADTLLFHLTRLAHMAVSCVGCGQCESACPRKLPLTLLFQGVGECLQVLFGYVPGRDLSEEMPLATFREDELKEVAE